MLSDLRPHWPILAFLASAAMLAGAHGFELLLGLAPCALCLKQREFHWAILALAILCFALLRFRPGLAALAAGVLGLGFLASACMGAYHVAVEQHWVLAQCETNGDLSAIRSLGADERIAAPRCDVIAWSLFGISMAGYNALISLALALASFAVALAPARKAAHA
jgi:disulfide bond formation protein DsbB